MVNRKGSTQVLRLAACFAIFAALNLSGCDGAGGSSSSGAASNAPAAASPSTATPDPIAFSADNLSVSQSTGSVTLTVTRSGSATSAASVDFDTADGTAIAGTDYTGLSGTLDWAENDSSPKTITVPVSNSTAFSGVRSFQVVLTNPSDGARIDNPGTATVSVSGTASTDVGSVQLSGDAYSVDQAAGTVSITVNRTGGSNGAVSVAYGTANGTAVSGSDYTTASGILEWADGDATSKTFTVSVSNATAFTGDKTFSVALSDARSGITLSGPTSATVTIKGRGSAAAGSLQLSASSFTVAQSAGTLKISVTRTNGSYGTVSVAYATSNGTAVAGTDYTTSKGTLTWASGDTAAKTISVTISNSTPFSGAKSFKVALSNPSARASIGSPGTGTVTINGSSTPAPGAVELSKSSYSVTQGAGSLTITVNRTGGSAGAASVAYATTNGTAVAGTDYTTTSGTLKWADADGASKTFSIPISGATPFSGTRSFTVKVSGATGSTLGSPASASVAITGSAAAAIGSVQLSSSSYAVAQSAGSVSLTVNRTGGTSGAISVKYATTNGTAVAGTDYTAASGTLNWADGDASSKTIAVAVSTATGFSGTKAFTLALSNATNGATLSSPNSATVTITGSSASSGSGTTSGTTFWVYHNGTFNWTADFSFLASINYTDTGTTALSGPYTIGVSITGAYGGFQPYSVPGFDTSKYKYLIFSVKPTVSNQVIGTGFDANNDVADGIPLTIAGPGMTKYGPAPVANQWNSYKIPIADFGFNNPLVLKFSIADGTGNATNKFYVDNVGFTN